ncbi:MAG: TIGR00282 family metallophosphoesterase [bacterium]
MKVLFLGDVVAKGGRKALHRFLPEFKTKYDPDLIIANAENAAGGIGLTPEVADEIFISGVDVMTSGNHIWKHKEIFNYLDGKSDKLIRPLNYPSSDDYETPGVGYTNVKKGDQEFVIINIMGRTFVESVDCPFKAISCLLKRIDTKGKIVIVDFHAETTSEKQAMGWYLNGKVSAMVGTHTHVQTADERILPEGTAYITDVGMCGSMDTVIGVDREIIIQRFITQRPVGFKFSEINVGINGVYLEFEPTGKALKIERISKREY